MDQTENKRTIVISEEALEKHLSGLRGFWKRLNISSEEVPTEDLLVELQTYYNCTIYEILRGLYSVDENSMPNEDLKKQFVELRSKITSEMNLLKLIGQIVLPFPKPATEQK